MRIAKLVGHCRSWLPMAAVSIAVALASISANSVAQEQPAAANASQAGVFVYWDRVLRESNTTPTMLVVVISQFLPGSPVRKRAYEAISNLNARSVRFVPWATSPRMSVAELAPPTSKGTSWDFKEIDPQVIPFLEATKGREPVVNFSVIPRWMFKTTFDVEVPADPNQLVWNYSDIVGAGFGGFGGSGKEVELVDPSGKQVGDYYARLVSWYTKGGFTDENGVYHKSGHKYSFPWWEVMSEMDNGEDIKLYNTIYDSVVTAIRKVSPETKFSGFSANCGPYLPQCAPENLEYFLDPKNHAPGVPIDRVSYHSYVIPPKGGTGDQWEQAFFTQADWFLETVKYAEATRRRLRPQAGTDINEVGCMLLEDLEDVARGVQKQPPAQWTIPDLFWNACGAYYAYMFTGLARLGINEVKSSQLFGYRGQFASVSMLNPDTGLPNARYRVLELIVKNFRAGDKLVQTDFGSNVFFLGELSAQAFITSAGKKLLLVNRRNRQTEFTIKTDAAKMNMDVVDLKTGGEKPRREVVRNGKVSLAPFAVAVVSMP